MKPQHFFILICILCSACRSKHHTQRAFYYWKTVFHLSPAEQQALQQTKTTKLYIKFFDVTWNTLAGTANPVAKLQPDTASFHWADQQHISIVPTVFITNESLQRTYEPQLTALADNLYRLLTTQIAQYALPVQEIQFDCDWTATTRDKYFTLLQYLHSLPYFRERHITMSATIRLYQCKYRSKTGIPPVDRGLLMCYNMGNLKDPDTDNSILESAELEKYITSLKTYPLPMDIAFPLFEWKVWYRNNIYSGLLQTIPDDSLLHQPFVQAKANRFFITTDTTWNGYVFKKGDILRSEKSNPDEILNAAAALRSKWSTNDFTVSLFHLDSAVLTKYPLYELEKIFTAMQ